MVDVPRTADVVIVGGGVHGASLAYHLARKKAGRVVLIEKKFIASGPTGRSTALVRRFYAMDFFTRTASAAAEVFRRWKDVIGGDGDPGFQQVGLLALAGPDKAAHLRHNALQAQKLGAAVALISPADVKALVAAGGRAPEEVLILPGLNPMIASTEAEAQIQGFILQLAVDSV